MIYLHILLPIYLPTCQLPLHIRIILLYTYRVPDSYTLLIVTLRQRYRHNGILVISTTDHREPE
jgi:hypothetical protein